MQYSTRSSIDCGQEDVHLCGRSKHVLASLHRIVWQNRKGCLPPNLADWKKGNLINRFFPSHWLGSRQPHNHKERTLENLPHILHHKRSNHWNSGDLHLWLRLRKSSIQPIWGKDTVFSCTLQQYRQISSIKFHIGSLPAQWPALPAAGEKKAKNARLVAWFL